MLLIDIANKLKSSTSLHACQLLLKVLLFKHTNKTNFHHAKIVYWY